MDKIIKKYELVDVGDDHNCNRKVYRIKALHDFGAVKKGDMGGYVENEDNLSHSGECWIFGNAYVIDKARVYEDAIISSSAWVFDNAEVFGNANVSDDAFIYHMAKVFGKARVYDQARVYNSAQVFDNAIVHGNARIKSSMKSSKPVTIIDNSEVVITITDDRIHVYQSTVYKKDKLPQKYIAILDLLESSED
jgi:NDP-sugar pyrophosphorylase family protein